MQVSRVAAAAPYDATPTTHKEQEQEHAQPVLLGRLVLSAEMKKHWAEFSTRARRGRSWRAAVGIAASFVVVAVVLRDNVPVDVHVLARGELHDVGGPLDALAARYELEDVLAPGCADDQHAVRHRLDQVHVYVCGAVYASQSVRIF